MSGASGHGSSRREFLKHAAGATMVVAGVGAGVAAESAAAGGGQVVAGRRYFVSVDVGGLCQVTEPPSGGIFEDLVVIDAAPGEHYLPKHLGDGKFEDIKLSVGAAMSKSVNEWIKDSLAAQFSRKSGTLIAADYDYRETARRTFTDALITEVKFPDLDTSAKTGADIIVMLTPSVVTDHAPTGHKVKGAAAKKWHPASFALDIPGVDCKRVRSIDSFAWRCDVPVDGSPPVLSVSDLVISFDPVSMPSWQAWYDNFVVLGDAADERNGTLTIHGAGGALLTLGLFNLGIYRLTTDKDQWSSASFRRGKAAMYCEVLTCDITSAAT